MFLELANKHSGVGKGGRERPGCLQDGAEKDPDAEETGGCEEEARSGRHGCGCGDYLFD